MCDTVKTLLLSVFYILYYNDNNFVGYTDSQWELCNNGNYASILCL